MMASKKEQWTTIICPTCNHDVTTNVPDILLKKINSALARERKEARAAAFKEVIGIAENEMVDADSSQHAEDYAYNRAIFDVVEAIQTAATSSPALAESEQPSSLIADAIAKVREMETENKRNYEYWKSIASEPIDMGVMKFLCWAGEDSRVIAMLESLAPAERTEVEGEQLAIQIVGTVFDNTAASHETLKQTMIERIADWLAAAPADNDAER